MRQTVPVDSRVKIDTALGNSFLFFGMFVGEMGWVSAWTGRPILLLIGAMGLAVTAINPIETLLMGVEVIYATADIAPANVIIKILPLGFRFFQFCKDNGGHVVIPVGIAAMELQGQHLAVFIVVYGGK